MKLALFGGTPVIPDTGAAHLPYPPVGAREAQYVLQALHSGDLWGPFAPMTVQLEKRWAEYVGVRFCVAMNSGTAALHSALAACGIGWGDDVIVPAYGFIASASCALMAGAIPVFSDVDPISLNLTAQLIEQAITPGTRAVVVVHLHGLPADMDDILALAARHSLVVIEDCAQAHGGMYRGRRVGSLGVAAAFSLNASKTLAGPEGGLLVTSDPEILNRAARLRVFGAEWKADGFRERDADCVGYNYRTNELCSAFALARLEAFEEETTARIANATRLRLGLADLDGLRLPPAPDGDESRHIYQMLRLGIETTSDASGQDLTELSAFRTRVVEALAAEGCRWFVWERRILPAYRLFQTRNAAFGGVPWSYTAGSCDHPYDPAMYPGAVLAAASGFVTTSHYPPNGTELIDRYIEAFRKVWEQRHLLI